MRHIKMLPPDQFSVTHKKDLYHRITFILSERNDILIFTVAVRYLLLLCNALDAVVQIPIADSIFKGKLFRGFLHLLLQILQDRLIIPVQKIQSLLNTLPVFFLSDIFLTGRETLFDMIVQTGPVLPGLLREILVACPEHIKLIY